MNKYLFKVNNKDTRTTFMLAVLVSLLLPLNRYMLKGNRLRVFFPIIMYTRKVKQTKKNIQENPDYNILCCRGKIKKVKQKSIIFKYRCLGYGWVFFDKEFLIKYRYRSLRNGVLFALAWVAC